MPQLHLTSEWAPDWREPAADDAEDTAQARDAQAPAHGGDVDGAAVDEAPAAVASELWPSRCDLWSGNWPAPVRVYVMRTRPYGSRWDAPRVIHLGAREPLLLDELAQTYGGGTYSLRPYGYSPRLGVQGWLPGATTVHLDAPPSHVEAMGGTHRGGSDELRELREQVAALAGVVGQLATRPPPVPADPLAGLLQSVRAARELVSAVGELAAPVAAAAAPVADDDDDDDDGGAAAPVDPWTAIVMRLADGFMSKPPPAAAPAPPVAGVPRIVGRVEPEPAAPTVPQAPVAEPRVSSSAPSSAPGSATWNASDAAAALAAMPPEQALAELDRVREALPPATLLAMAAAAQAAAEAAGR